MEIKASHEDIKTFVFQSIEKHETAMEIMNDELQERIVATLIKYSEDMYA